MLKVSAPGKLFLSGEWSILEVRNPGIVTAVDKRVFVELEESDKITLNLPEFNIENLQADFDGKQLNWSRPVTDKEKADLIFIKGAIETTLQYLGQHKKFKIKSCGGETQMEINGQKKKIGFGSSAAAVVATVSGLLAFNGADIKSRQVKDTIYKLATIAHFFAQGKVGSAFDVAASTYGGVFVYKRFDPKWLTEKLLSNKGETVKSVTEQAWPEFEAEELFVPHDFNLLVGWTKDSASTSAMVKQMDSFKTGKPEEYKRCYDNIANLVRELIPEWKKINKNRILELLRKNEDYLSELGQLSGVNIETPELKKMAEIANSLGGAGKLSGAGGGDCGIAVCFDRETADKILEEWKNQGICQIDTRLDKEGVKVES